MRDGVLGGELGAAQEQLARERGTVQGTGVEYGAHTRKLPALADRGGPQCGDPGAPKPPDAPPEPSRTDLNSAELPHTTHTTPNRPDLS
ncbi:hypothetical protein GCM10017778_00790 [Streptomyces vinaceus]|nr:hypothetical protein GCM10017778_00790 [Streptomyces vinaceus]